MLSFTFLLQVMEFIRRASLNEAVELAMKMLTPLKPMCALAIGHVEVRGERKKNVSGRPPCVGTSRKTTTKNMFCFFFFAWHSRRGIWETVLHAQ